MAKRDSQNLGGNHINVIVARTRATPRLFPACVREAGGVIPVPVSQYFSISSTQLSHFIWQPILNRESSDRPDRCVLCAAV